MARTRRRLALLLACSLVWGAGCATSPPYLRDDARTALRGADVLLMPADIELYLMTAAGMLEPRADWTAAAREHVDRELRSALVARSARTREYRPPQDPELAAVHTQLLKLHAAVGASIMTHKAGGSFTALPTLKDRFDWSLGEGAAALAAETGADYALFVHVRDSYTSAGRAAVMIVAAAAVGAALPGGQQLAFASLVDLRTGDIVWFNRLARAAGDLRTAEPAQASVSSLLEGLPL